MVKRNLGFLMICLMVLMTVMVSGVVADEWKIQSALKLKQWLQPPDVVNVRTCSDQRFDLCNAMIRFYQRRQYELAWVDRYGLLPQGEMALTALQQASEQDLSSYGYHNPWLNELLEDLTARPPVGGPAYNEKHVQLDLVMTEMMLRYAYHRTKGRTEPVMPAYAESPAPMRTRDLAVDMADAVSRNGLVFFLDRLGPPHTPYRDLYLTLLRYQKIRRDGGWPAVDQGPTLKKGDRDPRVVQLKNRLGASEDLNFTSKMMDDHFDELLEAAVMRFQQRHGLYPDGAVGANTIRQLNVPVLQRIRQIQLNMERWRLMPEYLGSTYLLVNIPGFELKIVEEGRVVQSMRTVVGRQSRPTPVLSSMMTYLELNPYWHVPTKIAKEDLLPKIKEDPYYLVRHDFRVYAGWGENARELNPYVIDWSSYSEDNFPFRLRQDPADHNALGRVKFMFANDFSVYIHDTPSKGLFKRASRDFSSGCVRVEKPMELVSYLLSRKNNRDAHRLPNLIASKKRRVVILENPVPVYLVYMTAWVGEEGEVNFREDIYGHDQQLLATLTERPPATQTCSVGVLRPNYCESRTGQQAARPQAIRSDDRPI